jgi:hypothetical protein
MTVPLGQLKLESYNPERKIKVGRTRLKWLEDVENDWWELKLKRRKQKANSREVFACVIK